MPYADKIIGIYKIVNNATGVCYVGQSQDVKKRVKEHFRLLRWNKHINSKLQRAYNKYGHDQFSWGLEAVCESLEDLDRIEEAFLKGEASFSEPTYFNIASFAKAPMRGNSHSEEVRARIRAARRASTFDYRSEEHRKKLSEISLQRRLSDKNYVDKLRFIVDNQHLSYAERARRVGSDTSTVRKLALKYGHLKGAL